MLDKLHNYMYHEHHKEMANMKQFHLDQWKSKKDSELQAKMNRQKFAKEVEIGNDQIDVANEMKRRAMHRSDEIRRDTIGSEQKK